MKYLLDSDARKKLSLFSEKAPNTLEFHDIDIKNHASVNRYCMMNYLLCYKQITCYRTEPRMKKKQYCQFG